MTKALANKLGLFYLALIARAHEAHRQLAKRQNFSKCRIFELFSKYASGVVNPFERMVW